MFKKIKLWLYKLTGLKKKTYSLNDVKITFQDYAGKDVPFENNDTAYRFQILLPDINMLRVRKMSINYDYASAEYPTVTVWYERWYSNKDYETENSLVCPKSLRCTPENKHLYYNVKKAV